MCSSIYLSSIALKYFYKMPEATMIILDNSEYSINGDYEPTRWLSQIEACAILIPTKMEQHVENAMGIILSAGSQVEVICAPSKDQTKVSSFLYGIKLHGSQKLSNALQTSALALKHRLNPNLTQRIICFVASTITDNIQELKIICKKLKKNNIALDLVAIGDLSEKQREILQVMHQSVKSQRDCQLLFVQSDRSLSDVLFSSKIIGAEQVIPMINEADDPELLMALQLSLQEEDQRLAAIAASNANQNPAPPQPMQSQEEELQQRALQLSLQQNQPELKKQEGKKEEQKKQ